MRRNRILHLPAFKGAFIISLGVSLTTALHAQAQEPTREELMQRLEAMSRELESTKAALRASEQRRMAAEQAVQTPAPQKVGQLEEQIAQAADLGPAKITPGDIIPALEGLKIGGAVRANYYGGDYTTNGSNNSSQRGEDGTISLDTFRLNLDYKRGPWIGKFEYRFYPGYSSNNSDGYHFLHTGWLGYDFDNAGQLQVGVNRVPFGPSAYGISQSWFFDQHYYAGLSDDMDLGIKYTTKHDNWTFDLAYYFSDEGNWTGSTNDSSRYSYDVVDETGDGYEERNQFNARVVYATQLGEVNVDLGASAQFGLLKSNGPQDDGEHYAFSLHPVFKWNNWTLAPQLTYYKYDIDAYVDTTDDGLDNPTDNLILFGAYDFPTFVATEAWMPAVSLSYYYEVNQVDWLDYMIPYAEYSAIMKAEGDFNDSEFITTGIAWGRGGWYIYTEVAFSNGNDFIGNEAGYGDPTSGASNDDGVFQSSRFGGNTTDDWETRFNINFGYYF